MPNHVVTGLPLAYSLSTLPIGLNRGISKGSPPSDGDYSLQGRRVEMPVYEEEPVERRRIVEEPVVERQIVEEPVVERRIVEEPVADRRVVRSGPDGWAQAEVIRYGFILLMTIIVLYFLARYIIPMLS